MGLTKVSITDDGIGFDLTELSIETIKELDSKDFLSPENTRGLGLTRYARAHRIVGRRLGNRFHTW